MKKLCLTLAVIVSFFALSTVSFAGQTSQQEMLNKIVYDSSIEETEQFLVTLTRPDLKKENTFLRTYVICGFTDNPDIVVALAIYNNLTKQYEDYYTLDEVSTWEIALNPQHKLGYFSSEVPLKRGANDIKLVAYKKSEIDNLEPGINVQVNYFTITLLDESMKDRIINGVIRIVDIFKSISNDLK